MTPIMRFWIPLSLLLLALLACDDMTKPAYVPKSEPRKSCFSDVECPGSKCVKGPNAVQGTCTASDDAGAPNAPGGPTPTPAPSESAPKPQPGDTQI